MAADSPDRRVRRRFFRRGPMPGDGDELALAAAGAPGPGVAEAGTEAAAAAAGERDRPAEVAEPIPDDAGETPGGTLSEEPSGARNDSVESIAEEEIPEAGGSDQAGAGAASAQTNEADGSPEEPLVAVAAVGSDQHGAPGDVGVGEAEAQGEPGDEGEPAGAGLGPVEPMTLPRVLAIANQKGGVGKTTTAVNLGAGLAELGYRVLVVDLDPQGNATTGLGISHRNVAGSIYDVIMNDVPIDDCVEPTTVRNLFVVPATIDLAGAEIELVPAFSRELKLRRALEAVRDEYDFTIIDCPPSLGLLTVNGLAAADDVIVPIQCEYYALEGLGQLLRNVALVRSNLNQRLDVRGIVLTMYDARTKLAEQVEQEVRLHFGARVYRTVVPRTVRLSEAPSFGQPITAFDASSRGATAYRELAKEVSRGATRRTG